MSDPDLRIISDAQARVCLKMHWFACMVISIIDYSLWLSSVPARWVIYMQPRNTSPHYYVRSCHFLEKGKERSSNNPYRWPDAHTRFVLISYVVQVRVYRRTCHLKARCVQWPLNISELWFCMLKGTQEMCSTPPSRDLRKSWNIKLNLLKNDVVFRVFIRGYMWC